MCRVHGLVAMVASLAGCGEETQNPGDWTVNTATKEWCDEQCPSDEHGNPQCSSEEAEQACTDHYSGDQYVGPGSACGAGSTARPDIYLPPDVADGEALSE